MSETEELIAELQRFGRLLGDDDAADPAWGRERLVDEIVEHLGRPGPRSFLLVGEPGVGKTHVLHDLARRLNAADPSWLTVATSTTEMLADTRYTGEWETKLKNLLSACKAPRRVLLCFTDVNNVVTAGTWSRSDISFANLLQPYMERGEVVVCGETPARELQLGLERLPMFARLFTRFTVDPFGAEQTARTLRRVVERRAARRAVDIVLHDEALDMIMDLGATYLGLMHEPGRSVVLLEQVLSRRLEGAPVPPVEVSADDVIAGLAATTGLPERLLSDRKALDPAEVRGFFEERVLGQDEGVAAVVDLITVIKAGLTDPTKPLAVFLFVGPTGVGKTEIAKTLAEYIFGSADRMIRVDMSEYKEGDSLEKLIGSPWRPETGTTLVARIRAQPFSVLLLDELEKAHPHVFDLCLQMFDDGRLTDARGRTADFRRTIIIMTSNLASGIGEGGIGFGDGGEDVPGQETVLRAVRRFFRPEFVNRLDKIVVFKPLSPDVMRKIVRRELGKVMLRSGILRRRLLVDVDPAVVDILCREGFSAAFGARPLKRRVADLVLVPLARDIVRHKPDERGSLLRVAVEDDRVVVRRLAAREQRVAERLRLKSPEDEHVRAVRPAELPAALGELDRRLGRLEGIADAHAYAARKSHIVAATAEPTFWDDGGRARALLAELVQLESLIDGLGAARRKLEDLKEFAKAYARHGTSLKTRFERSYGSFVDRLVAVEHQFFAESAEDRSDALLALRRIGPGKEASEALELVEKMYTSWAEKRGFAVTQVSHGDDEAVWRVEGVSPYGLLKGEEGLHRFDARGPDRRVQPVVRVEVLPIVDGERRVARRDVRIDRAVRGGRLEVIAVHAASGTTVEASVPATVELSDDAILDWLDARIRRPPRDLDRVVRRYGIEGKFAEDEDTGARLGQKELAAGGLDELLRARLYM